MNFLNSLFSFGKSVLGGIGGAAKSIASPVTKVASSAGSSLMNLFNRNNQTTPSISQGTARAPAQGTTQGQNQGSFLSNLFSGQSLGGLGLLLGSQLMPKPKVPNFPQSFENFKSMAESGGTPIGQLGTSKLTGLLNTDLTAATEDELNAATHDLELAKRDEIDKVNDLYRNLRPGTDPSSDSAYRRDIQEVADSYDRAIADTRATLRRQVTRENDAQRLNQIIASQGLSQEQMSNLMRVAEWDIARIAEEFNIDAEAAAQLKQFLMDEGSMLLNSGLGLNQGPVFNMFQGA